MDSAQKIRTKIYTYLALRDHSSSQIEQKLLDKGFELADITPVLSEFRAEGLINDQRYLESYCRYRQARGYGPQRIRQELLAQGLPKEMVEAHLKIADNAWFAEAKRVWHKRFRGKKPEDLKEKGKQFRFLQYRGFTSEQIENIFDN